MLEAGQCLTPAELMRLFEASHATHKGDIRHLRDRMSAPVDRDGKRGGWVREQSRPTVGTQYERPGFWRSAEEILARLTMQHLLVNLEPRGWLGSHIAALAQRLAQALDGGLPPNAEVARSIRVQTAGARRVQLPYFPAIASSLLRRNRVDIVYHARSQNQTSKRELSTQRLVHYRDYRHLDAGCRLCQGLRSFSVEAVHMVNLLDRAAIEVPAAELDAALGAGHGSFAGRGVT